MIKRAIIALILALSPILANAQEGPAEIAMRASIQLEAATVLLGEAQSARDRTTALTQTVRAYEDGLAAMRDGLRRVAIREQALNAKLDAKSDEIAELLGALQVMGRTSPPLLLLHPLGPTGTARSGMILADITPALQSEVEILRADLEEADQLQAIQRSAAQVLQDGLEGAQTARAALTAAMADRAELPRKFIEDPIQTALLIASTETLDAFAGGLAEIVSEETDADTPDARALAGGLALPANGTVLRRFNEADAAGVVRPGWILATGARALVSAPAAATIRYQGPLLDYGLVVILEPAPDVLWILAGLGDVFGQTGEIIGQNAPIGLMSGESDANLTNRAQVASADLSETLYIEVRDTNIPVDPADWFATQQD